MSRYFHFTTVMLEPGSRMAPGNWGRFFRTYDVRSNLTLLSSELIVEQVRKERFPELPSRFACNFVFEDETVARAQRPANFGNHFRLYEVRLVEPDAAKHRAAFNLFNQRYPTDGIPFLPYTEELAHRYWSGENIQIAEVLTTSPLEFVRCLD